MQPQGQARRWSRLIEIYPLLKSRPISVELRMCAVGSFACSLGVRNLSPKASSRLACAPRCREEGKEEGLNTNLGSILKVRELSSALLYHTLLDPVLSESCDDIRHPPSPVLSFGNFRTISVTSGSASADTRTSAASELAPF
jgi:hypothetical protein